MTSNPHFKNMIIKRICAYAIDILIVELLVYSISMTPCNPKYDDYNNDIKNNEMVYEQFIVDLSTVDEVFKDGNISKKEKNTLLKMESLQGKHEYIEKNNDNENMQMTAIMAEVLKKYGNEISEINYQTSKDSIYLNIIRICVFMIYFSIMQFIASGQTLGKMLFKIKVISCNKAELNIWNYVSRYLILDGTIVSIIDVLSITFFTKMVYTIISPVLVMVKIIIQCLLIIIVLKRADNRGLHDLISNTKVVDMDNNNI